MGLSFKNNSLNSSYEILAETDISVTLPKCKNHPAYNGKLSNIPNSKMLDGMLERKSNLIARKTTSGGAGTGTNGASTTPNKK